MSELSDRPFPRGALIGAAVMIATALCLATVVRLTGAPINSLPPPTAIAVRALQFVDRGDGAVVVYDARSGDRIQTLPPGTNGFARAMMRNFARERRSSGIGPETPFELLASLDGRLILRDPTTGRSVDLEAFGPTNAGVFAGFLPLGRNPGVQHD